MAQTPEEMRKSMIANMEEKTGNDLATWLKTATAIGAQKHGELVRALKGDHGMTHGFANLVAAEYFSQGSDPSDEDLLSAQYSGAKAALKPIYEAIISAVTAFGGDVVVSPKKTYVSLRRNKQFALIQASTNSRIDLGLCLKGAPTTERLENSGSFGSMVSHRVRLMELADVDEQLVSWLRQAYAAS